MNFSLGNVPTRFVVFFVFFQAHQLASRFCIDTLKSTVPIWKREIWESGESWGLEPQHIQEIDEILNDKNQDKGEVLQ